jgi:hypothetical protein
MFQQNNNANFCCIRHELHQTTPGRQGRSARLDALNRNRDCKLRMDEWTDKQTNARRTRLYLLVENWQFTQLKRQEESTPDVPSPIAATSIQRARSFA